MPISLACLASKAMGEFKKPIGSPASVIFNYSVHVVSLWFYSTESLSDHDTIWTQSRKLGMKRNLVGYGWQTVLITTSQLTSFCDLHHKRMSSTITEMLMKVIGLPGHRTVFKGLDLDLAWNAISKQLCFCNVTHFYLKRVVWTTFIVFWVF